MAPTGTIKGPGEARTYDGTPLRIGIVHARWNTQIISALLEGTLSSLRAAGVRAEVDHSDDRMPKKIRTHTTQKVPLQLIAGEQDRSGGTVSFRFRDGSQTNGIPVDEAIDKIVAAISGRLLINTAEDLV